MDHDQRLTQGSFVGIPIHTLYPGPVRPPYSSRRHLSAQRPDLCTQAQLVESGQGIGPQRDPRPHVGQAVAMLEHCHREALLPQTGGKRQSADSGSGNHKSPIWRRQGSRLLAPVTRPPRQPPPPVHKLSASII